MKFTGITIEPDKMGGVPCIRGLRIPVATVIGMVADGMSDKEILQAFPDLEPDDIRQALHYAAEAVTVDALSQGFSRCHCERSEAISRTMQEIATALRASQ